MIEYKKRVITEKPFDVIFRLIINMVLFAVLAFYIIMSFFTNARISGNSMNNTFMDGDVVLVNKRIYDIRPPKRYELIVFKPNEAALSENDVKRVVGLPGETVQIIDGKVHINGHVLNDDVISTRIYNAGLALEPVRLEDDEYFVLGDNRNSSSDSRNSSVGKVKFSSIIGKPWWVIYPFSDFGGTKPEEVKE